MIVRTPSDRADKLDNLKIVLTGPFGVGKTTLVGAVSDIVPLTTEARVSAASPDDTSFTPGKITTTVAMDFGRLAIQGVTVYVYGTPGQSRYWFMWDHIFRGAIGAVVLVDTRRLENSFQHIDYVEKRGVPFAVAVNRFPDAYRHDIDDIREALVLPNDVPIVDVDARDRDSVRQLLIRLIEHIISRQGSHQAAAMSHS